MFCRCAPARLWLPTCCQELLDNGNNGNLQSRHLLCMQYFFYLKTWYSTNVTTGQYASIVTFSFSCLLVAKMLILNRPTMAINVEETCWKRSVNGGGSVVIGWSYCSVSNKLQWRQQMPAAAATNCGGGNQKRQQPTAAAATNSGSDLQQQQPTAAVATNSGGGDQQR